MNNTTRKHPRTMQEAFGPYTDRQLHPKFKPASHTKDIALAVSIGLALALILFFYL